MQEYQQARGVHEPKDMRMRGYQQAHRTHKPKDNGMWGYEVTSKHSQTRWYEDAGMQARAHELEDKRMQGCEKINNSNLSNM